MLDRCFYFVLLLVWCSQAQENSLENKLYDAIDWFVAKPSDQGLKILESEEKAFWKNSNPKTKNELLAVVVLNCNKGYFQNLFGNPNQALVSYEKAWQIFQKHQLNSYDITEYCLKPLGNIYTVLGDYDNAANTIKQYYFIADSEKNQSQKIAAILNLSNVYQSSGDSQKATDLLEITLKNEKLSNSQKGNLYNNLGNNYLLTYSNTKSKSLSISILQKIENTYQKAIGLLKNDPLQVETVGNCYRNLSALQIQAGKIAQAESYFEHAKKYFYQSRNISNRSLAKFHYDEANLLFEQQKFNDANKVLQLVYKALIKAYLPNKSSFPDRNLIYAETILLDALDLQAEIFVAQNAPKKALEAYSIAFDIEDLFTNLLVYENSKIINQIRTRHRAEKCIAIYDFLFKKEKTNLYLEKAFQLAERTKAGILYNHVYNKKQVSKEENLYLKQLQQCHNDILKEQEKGSSSSIATIGKTIRRQNEMMLSLKKIRKNAPATGSQTINSKALYSKLVSDKALLVEYFWGQDRIYIFWIENQKIKLEQIATSQRSFPELMAFLGYFADASKIADDAQGYSAAAHKLYQKMGLPAHSSSKNLMIIPDGLFNFLPFEALLTRRTTTTNFSKMPYLLNDFTISYHNSASLYLTEKQVYTSKKAVLGIFPIFENTADELPYSKTEMDAISKQIDGDFLSDQKASFKNFGDKAAQYSILHLSTHAYAGDTESPAKIKFYDQDIFYSELYQLNINPQLVVLSACETGIGKLYKSEGAMSVARGFQFAGAQNLIFSLWKVNDFTSSLYMDKLYQNMYAGDTFAKANTQAKVDFLNDPSISNAKKSPYYWSAFVYYGSLDVGTDATNYYWVVLCVFVLIGLILSFKLRRK